MRIACGVDTIRISRIRDIYNRAGDRFLDRVYTAVERHDCESKGNGCIPSLAARFAAKEAVSKALGTGIGREGVRLNDMEIVSGKGGQPFLILHGRAKEYFLRIGGLQAEISMSHDGDQATAVCVMQFEGNLEREGPDEETMEE